MREFCLTVESPGQRERLLAAIHGNGAFGRFKTLAGEYGILHEWYAFQEEALREIARDWCEENGIPYDDKRRFDRESPQPQPA